MDFAMNSIQSLQSGCKSIKQFSLLHFRAVKLKIQKIPELLITLMPISMIKKLLPTQAYLFYIKSLIHRKIIPDVLSFILTHHVSRNDITENLINTFADIALHESAGNSININNIGDLRRLLCDVYHEVRQDSNEDQIRECYDLVSRFSQLSDEFNNTTQKIMEQTEQKRARKLINAVTYVQKILRRVVNELNPEHCSSTLMRFVNIEPEEMQAICQDDDDLTQLLSINNEIDRAFRTKIPNPLSMITRLRAIRNNAHIGIMIRQML